ncbi:MAG: enoyl-CoA hydratase/isomerase family protein [Pseudomonadota bacterium]
MVERKELNKVIYEKDGNIATITLNYPEKLNAMDFPGDGGITDSFYQDALGLAEEDDEIKVVLIKAAGKAFCSGHDLNRVGFIYGMEKGKKVGLQPRLKTDYQWVNKSIKRLFLFPKITVAVIHGKAIGEGTIIAESCDMVVASEDAIFSRRDQRLAFGGQITPLVVLIYGLKRALDLFLTGRDFTAAEAFQIGLVNRLVPRDKLDEASLELAKDLAKLGRDVIAIGKAARHQTYSQMGVIAGWDVGPLMHTMGTLVSWYPGEYNFFKERKEKGTKAGFHGLHDQFEKDKDKDKS